VTRLLTRSQIHGLLETPQVLETLLKMLRHGFAHDQDGSHQPPGLRVRAELPGPGTATALLPGLLHAIPAYTVKVNAKFPTPTPRCAAWSACTTWPTARCWPCWTPPR